jgi:hypothetical protein
MIYLAKVGRCETKKVAKLIILKGNLGFLNSEGDLIVAEPPFSVVHALLYEL